MNAGLCLAVTAIVAMTSEAAALGSDGIDWVPIPPIPCAQDAALSYDDGIACWMGWMFSDYVGVWFHLEDFGSTRFECGCSEYWFYHNATYPWDVSEFYAELWYDNGMAPFGPDSMLDRTSSLAYHYAPSRTYYSPLFVIENADFWVISNASMSSEGCPSHLEDGTTQSPDHSFYSYDYVVWEPISSYIGDVIYRADGELTLNPTTWGAIKATF
jgi:hypothetical protein